MRSSFFNLIPNKLLDQLRRKFNIIGHSKFTQFDHDPDFLRNLFVSTYKPHYDSRDKYIIEHLDTDVYLPTSTVGILLQNFFEIVKELDVPLHTIILYTNHIGIQKEIDILCQSAHPNDRPTVIESFSATTHLAPKYNNIDINEDDIEYQALCMMGRNRSHRFALYHQLSGIDTTQLAMTIRGAKQ